MAMEIASMKRSGFELSSWHLLTTVFISIPGYYYYYYYYYYY
jgi:hypothetical protein